MIFKIVNPMTLTIEHSYQADEVQPWGGSWGCVQCELRS